jgi:cytidine deaminase
LSNAIEAPPVSRNPFVADPAIRLRQERLAASVGSAIRAEIAALISGPKGNTEANDGSVLPKQQADELVARHGLENVEELMLLALAPAKSIARPPISNFFVGAVGLERDTGDLIFGVNVEFPGTHLGFTIHGEGFVFTRAASRGTTIAAIAIDEAHPCAHCRQYLSEFQATRDLVLIDPLGFRLDMAELYPWPFDPDYLGEAGFVPGTVHPERTLGDNVLPAAIADRLLLAGQRAHAPYSRCPGAVVLALNDGATVSGFSVESVAFNPTMGPLQAAVIDLIAHGYAYSDIAEAALVTSIGGAVDYSLSVTELLGRLAPSAPLSIVGWA